jgi:CheY-like chemotaxis protein
MQDTMRTLVVDDDRSVLELLELSLNCLGFTDVETAQCAAEAMAIIAEQAEPFECFLIDIQMPETNGIELCELIRSIDAYRSTPVIMLTAMSERKYIEAAFAAGATDFVTKPFEAAELKSRIEMAWRMLEDAKQHRVQAGADRGLGASSADRPDFLISDPIDIEDMEGFLNCSSFRNLLRQLAASGSPSMSCTVLEIQNNAQIYAFLGSNDYRYYLTDVADALSENLSAGCLFTHVGNGRFLVVKTEPCTENPERHLSEKIEMTLEAMKVCYSKGHMVTTEIVQHDHDDASIADIQAEANGHPMVDVSIRAVEFEPPAAPFSMPTQKPSHGLWSAVFGR